MTEIPDDVMKAAEIIAKEATRASIIDPLMPYFIVVAPFIARAIMAERERCARIAENLYGWADIGDKDMDGVKRRHSHVMLEIAAQIRK